VSYPGFQTGHVQGLFRRPFLVNLRKDQKRKEKLDRPKPIIKKENCIENGLGGPVNTYMQTWGRRGGKTRFIPDKDPIALSTCTS